MPKPNPSVWIKPHVVYRAYNAADVLIYIGVTWNWPVRLNQHRLGTYWWTREVVRTRLTLWPDRQTAFAQERIAIREEKPVHNVHRHPPRKLCSC